MTQRVTVGRATFGQPDACPLCGGPVAPAFGQLMADDGTRRPVIDPNSAICRDCGTLLPTTEKKEEDDAREADEG